MNRLTPKDKLGRTGEGGGTTFLEETDGAGLAKTGSSRPAIFIKNFKGKRRRESGDRKQSSQLRAEQKKKYVRALPGPVNAIGMKTPKKQQKRSENRSYYMKLLCPKKKGRLTRKS